MDSTPAVDLAPTVEADAETVALSWLLDRGELGLVAHHLPEREVMLSWAHAIEVEDPSPWLRGAGLVLTTGLRFPRTRPGQDEYVARLAAAGSSALGFGTGLRYAAIPFGVVAACRRHDLALVEVPFDTPFLAVEQAVVDRLGELRRHRLTDTIADQQRLTRATLKDGLPGLARALARALGASVAVLAADGATIATTGGGLSPADALREIQEGRGRAVSVSEPGRVLEVQPLGDRPSEVVGWLALARSTPLTPTDRLLVSHALSIAALELARPSDGADRELGAALLGAILAGSPLDPPAALAARGFPPGDVALLALRAPDSRGLDSALSALRRHPRLLDLPIADTDALLLVPAADVDVVTRMVGPSAALVIGPPGDLADIGHCAALVRRHLDAAPSGTSVRLAGDPVAILTTDPALTLAVSPWLRALGEYDAAHGSDLTGSLRAFLLHHGAWDPAAQSLGVHRHTLRHRVERACDVAGIDLADPSQRAMLVLALV
ncbi:MAG: PucR family transcriptional regulator [Nocardioides sp.]|uniref:PucR family transcriptional regulator n=1 Tax=Nocardioides sp. TaxID=35761 RepID=UPI0039E3ADEB